MLAKQAEKLIFGMSTMSVSRYAVILAFSQNPSADDERVSQRLAAKDLDDWDQKRVKRLPGESDGVL